MTASSSGCTPLFLKEEPHNTGVAGGERGLADRLLEALLSDLGLLEDQLDQAVVFVGDRLDQVLARIDRRSVSSAGISVTSWSLPSSSV